MAAGALQLDVSDSVTEKGPCRDSRHFVFVSLCFQAETQVVFFTIITGSSVLNHNVPERYLQTFLSGSDTPFPHCFPAAITFMLDKMVCIPVGFLFGLYPSHSVSFNLSGEQQQQQKFFLWT